MCLPYFKNLTFFIPIIRTIIHPSVYHFRKKSTQFCSNWVAFYHNLLKIHPIYVILAPSSLMKTNRSLYQISWNSTPKGRHIYVYHVNVRTPSRETYSFHGIDSPPSQLTWHTLWKCKHENAAGVHLLTRKYTCVNPRIKGWQLHAFSP